MGGSSDTVNVLASSGRERNVRTRKQRVQSGHAVLVDARFHHPKLRVFAHHFARGRLQLGDDFHAFVVGTQADAADAPDFHIQKADGGGIDFDAFRIVHQQSDFRALLARLIHQKPNAGNGGNQRDNPHGGSQRFALADVCVSVF